MTKQKSTGSRERYAVLLLLLIVALAIVCARFIPGGSSGSQPSGAEASATQATLSAPEPNVEKSDSLKSKRKKTPRAKKHRDNSSKEVVNTPLSPLDNEVKRRPAGIHTH